MRPSSSVPRPIAEDKRPARSRPPATAWPAFAARGRPGENDALALPQPVRLAADRLDHAGAFVAEHDRRGPVPLALVRVQVGAADADGAHPDDDLARQRLLELDLLDLELAGLMHDRGARLHRINIPPLTSRVAPVTKPAASEAR